MFLESLATRDRLGQALGEFEFVIHNFLSFCLTADFADGHGYNSLVALLAGLSWLTSMRTSGDPVFPTSERVGIPLRLAVTTAAIAVLGAYIVVRKAAGLRMPFVGQSQCGEGHPRNAEAEFLQRRTAR